MQVIENFAALTEAEQRAFATELLNKINTEKLFYDDATFTILGIEVDEMTGNLLLDVDHDVLQKYEDNIMFHHHYTRYV